MENDDKKDASNHQEAGDDAINAVNTGDSNNSRRSRSERDDGNGFSPVGGASHASPSASRRSMRRRGTPNSSLADQESKRRALARVSQSTTVSMLGQPSPTIQTDQQPQGGTEASVDDKEVMAAERAGAFFEHLSPPLTGLGVQSSSATPAPSKTETLLKPGQSTAVPASAKSQKQTLQKEVFASTGADKAPGFTQEQGGAMTKQPSSLQSAPETPSVVEKGLQRPAFVSAPNASATNDPNTTLHDDARTSAPNTSHDIGTTTQIPLYEATLVAADDVQQTQERVRELEQRARELEAERELMRQQNPHLYDATAVSGTIMEAAAVCAKPEGTDFPTSEAEIAMIVKREDRTICGMPRKRFFVFCAIALLVAVGVIVAAVVVSSQNGGGGNSDSNKSVQENNDRDSQGRGTGSPTRATVLTAQPTAVASSSPTSQPSHTPSEIPSQAPSQMPSSSPTVNLFASNNTRYDDFISVLFANYTDDELAIVLAQKTSQRKAVRWLAEDDGAELDPRTTPFQIIQERYVMVTLFYEQDSSQLALAFKWLSDLPICDWTAIKCNNDGHVEKLRLSAKQLRGTLMTEIAYLSDLEVAQLSHNKFKGTIPTELGKLTKLTRLYLHNNKLAGSIPSEIGKLANLARLSLDHNRFMGAIPTELYQLSNLEKFSLVGNNMTGSFTPSICDEMQQPTEDGDFVTDCLGDSPRIPCACCTMCCDAEQCCDMVGTDGCISLDDHEPA